MDLTRKAGFVRRSKAVIMQTILKGVSSSIEVRPKGDGLKVGAKIEAFRIESFPGDEAKKRTLLTSDSSEHTSSSLKGESDVSRTISPWSVDSSLPPGRVCFTDLSVLRRWFQQSTPTDRKHLLDVCFEKNPLKSSCDHWVRVFAEPVEVYYDVRSFEAVLDVFKPPDDVSIDK